MLDITLSVVNEMDEDMIKDILQDLFDGGETVRGFAYGGLRINEGLSADALYGVFGIIENVVEVSIESDGSPVEDIVCPAGSVLSLGTVTVTQTIVE